MFMKIKELQEENIEKDALIVNNSITLKQNEIITKQAVMSKNEMKEELDELEKSSNLLFVQNQKQQSILKEQQEIIRNFDKKVLEKTKKEVKVVMKDK